MQPTLYEQTLVFLRAFGAGAVLALMYTVLSCIRAVSKPGKKLLFAGDLLFALLAGAISYIYSLGTSGGQLRAYAIAAEIAAFFALYLTLGRLLTHGAEGLVRLTGRLAGRIMVPLGKAGEGMRSFLAAAFRIIYRKMPKKVKKC